MNFPGNNESSAAERLAAARLQRWHQLGEALLTIENARSFLSAAGLVLFAPRPQIAAPAPSFVEAVLGETNTTPTPAQMAGAREMLARLVAEGLAVPLNLLGIGAVIGQPGDAPDFVASAQVFSYIFTLRGDKAWKQPPQATGAVRFSNLAIAANEALARRGPMTALDLVSELGKEVTEAAVLRALGELWTHLRVLPVPQLDGRATRWEPAGARLMKQMKAGANAGQPTALSALISLYLGQAIVAREDEIESFLSPLAARSRVRDVLHALLAAQQLETVAIEGRTMLHLGGAEPAFLSDETPVAPDAADETVSSGQAASAAQAAAEEEIAGEVAAVAAELEDAGPAAAENASSVEPRSRIVKFVPRKRPGTGDLAKARPAKLAAKPFAKKPFGDKPKTFGEKRPFVPRGDRARPAFGEKKPFAPREDRSKPAFGAKRPFAPRGDKGARPPFGERRGARAGEGAGGGERRPPFEAKRFAPPRDGEFKPRLEKRRFERRDGEGAKPDRERWPFAREQRGADRAPRRPFGREGGRPAGRKPFGGPKAFGGKREFAADGERPKREFKPKPFGRREESGGERKSGVREFGAKTPFAKRPATGKPFARRGELARPDGFAKPGGSGRFGRPFRDRETGEGVEQRGSDFAAKRFGRKPGAKSGQGFGARKFGSGKPGGGKFGGKRFDGAKPGGKRFGGRPSGRRKGGSGPKQPRGESEV